MSALPEKPISLVGKHVNPHRGDISGVSLNYLAFAEHLPGSDNHWCA